MFSKKRLFVTTIVLLLFDVAGCATYKAGTIDVRSVDTYACRTALEGISVAADSYDTSDKTKGAFYVDVTEEGFYPINLIIKNDSNSRVLILRETIDLMDTGGNIYRPVRSTIMSQTFEKNKMAYALLGFGIFSYMSAEEANKKMEADWREKELPEQLIILPDRKNYGFVYFQLPKGKTTKGDKIRLEAEKLESKEKIHIELTL